jgi:hypothetical protein
LQRAIAGGCDLDAAEAVVSGGDLEVFGFQLSLSRTVDSA